MDREFGEYIDFADCFDSGEHLTDCDDDGFCHRCGYQQAGITADGLPIFTDEQDAE